MKLSTTQKITGGIAAGIGAFFIGFMGDLGKGAGKIASENDFVKETINKQMPQTASAQNPANDIFEQDYAACNDQSKQNPNVDINDSTQVYEATIRCMLTQKNQGAELDKHAQTDENLKSILDKIRHNAQ